VAEGQPRGAGPRHEGWPSIGWAGLDPGGSPSTLRAGLDPEDGPWARSTGFDGWWAAGKDCRQALSAGRGQGASVAPWSAGPRAARCGGESASRPRRGPALWPRASTGVRALVMKAGPLSARLAFGPEGWPSPRRAGSRGGLAFGRAPVDHRRRGAGRRQEAPGRGGRASGRSVCVPCTPRASLVAEGQHRGASPRHEGWPSIGRAGPRSGGLALEWEGWLSNREGWPLSGRAGSRIGRAGRRVGGLAPEKEGWSSSGGAAAGGTAGPRAGRWDGGDGRRDARVRRCGKPALALIEFAGLSGRTAAATGRCCAAAPRGKE